MNVSLTPELDRLVKQKLKSGMYKTASEVVREALRLLKQRDEQFQRLRADVQAGLDQIERGASSDYSATSLRDLASRVKRRGRNQLGRRSKTAAR